MRRRFLWSTTDGQRGIQTMQQKGYPKVHWIIGKLQTKNLNPKSMENYKPLLAFFESDRQTL